MLTISDLPMQWLILMGIGSCSLVLFKITYTKNDRKNDRQEAQEPPYIAPKVPLIGHLISMTQKRAGHYFELFMKSGFDIFTLTLPGMPSGKVYVVSSPDIFSSLQRMPANISMRPVQAKYTPKLAGLGRSATKVFQEYVQIGDLKPSYLKAGIANVHTAMMPGQALSVASEAAIHNLAISVEKFEQSNSTIINMRSWVENEVMLSATNSIFGGKNPFRKPETIEAYRDFAANAGGLMFVPFPRYTCAKAYAGRAKVAAAFQRFYDDGGSVTASAWVQGATKISNDYRISNKDKAAMDIANTHGIISNTTPTAFWTLYHIFSDNAVLEEVRTAVGPLLTITKDKGHVTYDLDVSDIKGVPILKSILQEVLRYYSRANVTRQVVENTVIQNRYLLKKGSFVFMPHRSFHFNPKLWGSTVDDFNARRSLETKEPRGAFIGFGGGQGLCPGRFFAQTQVLALCAMMAVRYDIKPIKGPWKNPGVDDSDVSVNIHPPKCESLLVNVSPRNGWSTGVWRYKFSIDA